MDCKIERQPTFMHVITTHGRPRSEHEDPTLRKKGTGENRDVEDGEESIKGSRQWLFLFFTNTCKKERRAVKQMTDESKTLKTEKTEKEKKEKPEVKGDLEHQTWYHGFRPRKDVVALLKEPGDFLVRATDSRNMPEIVISVLNDKKELDLLGKGNFCNVYKGILTRTPEEKITVAVKMFGVACDHPPILIVMEYCPGGDLQSHLKKQKSAIEVGERIVYTIEAARGMRYLHRKNCIHRDLAARNCLISAKGSMKIADFGLSKLVNDLEKQDKEKEEHDKDEPSPQIPLRWMAPESLKRPMKFSTKTDVWSFAVMMYEIFNCGMKPWPDEPPKKIATMIRKCHMPPMPDGTPEEVKTLTSQIWVVDPAARPTMSQVCSTLFGIMKTYRPPPADKFTLNTIPGVSRAAVDAPMTMEDGADNTEEEPLVLKPVSSIERYELSNSSEHATRIDNGPVRAIACGDVDEDVPFISTGYVFSATIPYTSCLHHQLVIGDIATGTTVDASYDACSA
ncbi:SH2 domain protein [Teladorsagia circumcincta]|uniref:non-specific protein-tyrosine kinase n=1 Tax=Teladorsagia circumcincta TaxID=45464 RepID=A0A2G9UHG3_TELCI|nr:SH2 domain protein [Teladorsagia circumcincta]